jgi:hypothetical protein
MEREERADREFHASVSFRGPAASIRCLGFGVLGFKGVGGERRMHTNVFFYLFYVRWHGSIIIKLI